MEIFCVCSQMVDLVGDTAVNDLAVGSLDESEFVDATISRQRSDETDVGTFWGLNRTHTTVVRRVHVADLEAGALARETTGPKRGETTLVRQTRERVGLIHELRQLARAEELLDGGNDRADVDQRLRRDGLDVLCRHALANNTLHP